MNKESEWKDISTAPRDRSDILVGWYEEKLYVGHDRPEIPEMIWKCATVWASPLWEGWCLVETGAYSQGGDLLQEPTRWCLIPTPPPLP